MKEGGREGREREREREREPVFVVLLHSPQQLQVWNAPLLN